jgi:uncharacterized LabA/DUF88 family protein
VDARIFVDFWNFSLNWRDHANNANADWKRLPAVLMSEAESVLSAVSPGTTLSLEETLVYASIKPQTDQKLKQWLTNFVDRQPSFRVKIRERRVRNTSIYCAKCQTKTKNCPKCGAQFQRAAEKGVDTAIVTDLLSLAWEGAYDVAILVSSDADFIPAVERIQEKGLKVVNATWDGHGHNLAHTCWASFSLDRVIDELVRS